MFANKASAYSCRLWPYAQTRLERPARVKLSSLLQTLVNYGRKTFNEIGPRSGLWRSVPGSGDSLRAAPEAFISSTPTRMMNQALGALGSPVGLVY
jgi:hypothetical protein